MNLEELREQCAKVCRELCFEFRLRKPSRQARILALAEERIRALPLAPLAPEVQEAVELANLWKDFPERDVGKLARALLKVLGHE